MIKIINVIMLIALLISAAIGVSGVATATYSGDIGSEAIWYNLSWSANYTVINLNDPCDYDGAITKVQIYLYTNGYCPTDHITVGTFYNTGGNNYTCRDYELLPLISCGYSESTVSLIVKVGDVIGYSTPTNGGSVCTWQTGGSGLMYGSRDDYLLGNHTYAVHNVTAVLSLSGTGVTDAEKVLPLPVALTVIDITDRQAQIGGGVASDGNWEEYCTASLGYWSDIDEGLKYVNGNETVGGNATTGETYGWLVTDLVPDQEYYAYFVLENEIGRVYSEPVMFSTLPMVSTAKPEPDTKVAEVSNVMMFGVWTYGLKFNARMGWDGGQNSVGGFEYRIKGNSTWIRAVELSTIIHTGDYWFSYVYGMTRDTLYEYRAYATNIHGTGYGDMLEIRTSGIAFPTPTGGAPVPWELPEWLTRLSGLAKTLIAIAVTIAGMILLAIVLSKSTVAVFVVLAWAILATIGFIVLGWYSEWIIILLAAIVGLGILFLLIGRK